MLHYRKHERDLSGFYEFMKTIMIELTEEMAGKILPILEREAQSLQIQIARIRSGMGGFSGKQAGVTTGPERLTAPQLPSQAGPPQTPGKRAKKGASEGFILDFLKLSGGDGVSVKEIVDGSKTSYGTCVRILRQLDERGEVESNNRLWKWKGHK